MAKQPSTRVIPTPLEVLRVLPRIGLHLLLPAMVIGAVGGSLFDLLLRHEGYPLAMAGLLIGPVVFATVINALERLDQAHAARMTVLTEAYQRAETAKRQARAKRQGELVKFEEHRAKRR
ncbi:hypothetical protein JANAI62_26980 [Jannaschia pagri]|uniref:AtpZ/AtpI family protein n=1 Tax=Jannaschia pagri TaxID=2829797 RepID=A0ABQ4NP71_9RHOB|nr:MULTISPECIES: hypothetical protein [unclassified Jannaschia]GIT92241.1 hypothetical protein JANAI61_26990 [Jannaschia sp. AI_61]GIT96075.1 hypothetical protein JANAI62_26980 [Jannaschia sp. AI_62]